MVQLYCNARSFGRNLPNSFQPRGIETAAGDTATAAIFGLLGNPGEAQAQFKDKTVLVGANDGFC